MKAFVIPSFSDCHIRLNVKGRERDGILDPAEYATACDQIEAELRLLVDPRTGGPIVNEVLRIRSDDPMAEIGPSPDLVVTFHHVTDVVEHPALGLIGPAPLMRMGEHTPEGWAVIRTPDGEPRGPWVDSAKGPDRNRARPARRRAFPAGDRYELSGRRLASSDQETPMANSCSPRGRRKGAALVLVFSLALVFVGAGGPQGSVSASDIRIMPLGDSLTDGFNIPGGYRIDLEDALTGAGRPFDFVGGQFNGPVSLADPDHEGHVGFTISEIDQSILTWLTANPTDVVLLMIGTNDLKTDDLTTIDDAGAAASRLSALVTTITDHDPAVSVLVSTIPPQGWFFGPDRAAAYNLLIPGVVSELQSQGRSVSFVDGAADLTTADLADQLHLTAEGYSKVAERVVRRAGNHDHHHHDDDDTGDDDTGDHDDGAGIGWCRGGVGWVWWWGVVGVGCG